MSRAICVTDKNIFASLESLAMTWWAEALNRLLAAKGFSKTQLAEQGRTSHRRLNRMYQGTKGPTLTSIQIILEDIGATWHDWAVACEQAKGVEPIQKHQMKHATRLPKVS